MSRVDAGDGKIIQVREPEPNPKFVVDDSPLKASLITVMSLLFFGVTLAGTVLRLASAHDLDGIRAVMMRDDTIGWAVTFWTVLGAPLWLWLRSRRSWFNKKRDVEIVRAADNDVAMLASEVAPIVASPPTRARETTRPFRMVDPKILHNAAPADAAPVDFAGTYYEIPDDEPVPAAAESDRPLERSPDIPGDALSPLPSRSTGEN